MREAGTPSMICAKSQRGLNIFNAGRPNCALQFGTNPKSALDKRSSGNTEGAGIWVDSLGAISHITLSQGAFRGNPAVSVVPPVSLLGFP